MLAGRDIGIDLGTANTVVFMKGKGIILRERSVVAKRARTGVVEAVGEQASRMIGRTPDYMYAIRPLHKGVIADFATTAAMLNHFIREIAQSRFLLTRKPHVVISVPTGATAVERRAVEDVALQAGAKKVRMIEAPMAAAIGAGLPVSEAMGSMVVDIGAGTTEVAIVSLGGIVTSQSLRVGGDDMDMAISEFIKRHHQLMIGTATAEWVKTAVGRAEDLGDRQVVTVRGRDTLTGLPGSCEVSSDEIARAFRSVVDEIIRGIKMTLEQTPSELAADVLDHGIVLTGGGSLLRQLDHRIQAEIGLPVIVADNPLDCVAVGAGKTLSRAGHSKRIKQFLPGGSR